MKTIPFLFVLAACGPGAKADDEPVDTESGRDSSSENSLPGVPGLVFQSGFEPGTQHNFAEGSGAPCTDDLTGIDQSVSEKGDWELDLEGGDFGVGHFCFGGGDRSQRQVNLVPDPEDANNQVLHMQLIEPGENVSDDDDIACNGEGSGKRKARAQHTLKESPALHSFDYRVRLRLGSGMQVLVDAPYEITWMTIGEFWNNNSAEDDSFRVTLNLVKPATAGAPFTFGLKTDTQANGAHTWEAIYEHVSDVVVPIEQWFILEVSVTEGDATTGRVIVHVTTADGVRHEVDDFTGWTVHPDGTQDGFRDINTMKLYTSGDVMCGIKAAGHTLDAWWDDYAIGAP
jgi:hypothetical protein